MEYRVIQTKRSKTSIWTRWIVCSLLLITGAADFISFLMFEKFRIFDMSPLTVLTGNILIIFICKFIILAGLAYLLCGVNHTSDYNRYLWIMMAVYLILFQTVGFINNRQVAAINPPVEQAPSEEVRLKTGINFSLLYAYYPIAFAMLSFFLWNIGWRKYDSIKR